MNSNSMLTLTKFDTQYYFYNKKKFLKLFVQIVEKDADIVLYLLNCNVSIRIILFGVKMKLRVISKFRGAFETLTLRASTPLTSHTTPEKFPFVKVNFWVKAHN